MRIKTLSLVLSGAIGAGLAGCSSSPNYDEIPVSKLPAGTAPKAPPPPPPNGAAASGTAPHYSETGSPGGTASAPAMPAPPPLPNR